MYKKIKNKIGFTLVEIIIALAIFTIFITIALATLFVSNSSSKKATAIKTAIDNVQYSMELFTRTARLGSMYTCFDANSFTVDIDITTGFDCSLISGQGVAFFVLDPTVVPNQTDAYAYYLENSQGNGQIIRCIDRNINSGGPIPAIYTISTFTGGDNCASLTASEIDIDSFDLFVEGSSPTDTKQPSIKVVISGNVLVANDSTPFKLQTFISQRQYE